MSNARNYIPDGVLSSRETLARLARDIRQPENASQFQERQHVTTQRRWAKTVAMVHSAVEAESAQ